LGALAHVFAANNEEGFLDVVDFDRAGADAAFIDEGLGTSGT
jgi:hypothetical protein